MIISLESDKNKPVKITLIVYWAGSILTPNLKTQQPTTQLKRSFDAHYVSKTVQSYSEHVRFPISDAPVLLINQGRIRKQFLS